MDEEFDPSLAPLPEGVLPDVYKLLKDFINSDLEKAVDYLQKDPLAVVALSKILKEIQTEKSDKSNEFKEYYDKLVLSIFSVEHLIDIHGLAFTTELLLGFWRKLNQQVHIESVTELILENLIRLQLLANKLESTSGNRVIFEIINDGLLRIQGMYNHEKTRAKNQLKPMTTLLDEFVGQQFVPFPKSGIPDIWHSLISIASMKHATAMEFRRLLATIVLNHLKLHFDEMSEDQKYEIAPYLALLDKISSSQ